MITPRFQIQQTETDLIFTIHAPYASIAEAEIYADSNIFCFYAAPYYLRLHLSGNIEETDASKGSYDADSGTFEICVQKVVKGEYFENLDFITALLTPAQNKKHDVAKPLIEVIESDYGAEENGQDEVSDDEGNDWYIDQCPFEEPSEDFLLAAPHYGFASKISAALQNFKTEFLEVIDLPNPDGTPVSQRSVLRLSRETEDFSDDHYLADWAQEDLIEPLLAYKPWWDCSSSVVFSDEERDILKDLPKKEFLLDKREEQSVFYSLIDILFAYAYNERTTMGESTVESAWTVNKISATLSWLQSFSMLKEAILVPVRRSLCYPLYRHWALSIKVFNDVKSILKLGRQQVLKCLLDVYTMFNKSEPRYILNQLYIRDYLIWIQHVSDPQIKSLLLALQKVDMCKSDVDLDLEVLETAGELVQREEEVIKSHKEAKRDQGGADQPELCNEIASLSLSEKIEKEALSDSSCSEASSSSSEDSSSSDFDSDDVSEEDVKP